MLQILSITLPQAKADNTPKELLNNFFFVSNQRKLQKKKKKKKKKKKSCYVGVLTTKTKIKQRKKVEKDKNDKNMS